MFRPTFSNEGRANNNQSVPRVCQAFIYSPGQTIAKPQRELIVPNGNSKTFQRIGQWTDEIILVLGCMTNELIPVVRLSFLIGPNHASASNRALLKRLRLQSPTNEVLDNKMAYQIPILLVKITTPP